jgi:hypothetical protein
MQKPGNHAKTAGHERSEQWDEVAEAHLRKQPHCVACAKPGEPVQVHHIFPFHFCVELGRPDLELDGRNLVTLCESEKGDAAPNHHLLLGHLGNFQSANLDVLEDVKTYFDKTAAEIKADPAWLARKKKRVPFLDAMTQAEKDDLLDKMNKRFPKAAAVKKPAAKKR